MYLIDPIQDARWDGLTASHPDATVFHQRGWLTALATTYGYRPAVVTPQSPGEPLQRGIVFCEVKSWLNGRRFVSLPFSDHCTPLTDEDWDWHAFHGWMQNECKDRHWNYVEFRPFRWNSSVSPLGMPTCSFWSHTLDLSASLERIFNGLHKDCLQRRIRHAERENLDYERGRSEKLVNEFYGLLLMTRRRHGLLPQPYAWFRNLVACLGDSLELRIAKRGGVAIAAVLSLTHRQSVVYKYGCSDERYHSLAPMPFLFWKLITESNAAGAAQLDFGRTDQDNAGLTAFKDRFGTVRSRISYFRFPTTREKAKSLVSFYPGLKTVFSAMPNGLSSRMGGLLYRHFG